MEQIVNANFWLSIYKKEPLLYSQTSATESYPYQETQILNIQELHGIYYACMPQYQVYA